LAEESDWAMSLSSLMANPLNGGRIGQQKFEIPMVW